MDPFKENLTLGIVKYFDKLPCIKSSVIAEKGHVQEAALTAWEQKNNCILPQDLKNFYLATDGLQIKWFWKQKGETVAVGSIEITRLCLLKCIGPKRQSINSELPTLTDLESDSEETCEGHIKPKFKDGCKIFVLDHCQGAGKVCLAYPKKKDSAGDSASQLPSIWFLDRALDFHYITADFASYYRLALAHLGIPQWQLLFTPNGPPTRTRKIKVIPHPESLLVVVTPHPNYKSSFVFKIENINDRTEQYFPFSKNINERKVAIPLVLPSSFSKARDGILTCHSFKVIVSLFPHEKQLA